MHLISICVLIVAAPASQEKLLKTFRAEFIDVTPGQGKFPDHLMMGQADATSASPVRRVKFEQPFRMGKYEVTQELYQAVMGVNPSRWTGRRNSVEMTSYNDAVQFCRKATTAMRTAGLIAMDEVVRLPTEAEWEYVARAGTKTLYSFGDDPDLLGQFAWFHGNAQGNDPPVGAKKPNAWGFYDMHGYLWEWCADAGHPNYKNAPNNPAAWNSGGEPNLRVIRGGSWKDNAHLLTSACRAGRFRLLEPYQGKPEITFVGGVPQALKDDALGFRCVISKK